MMHVTGLRGACRAGSPPLIPADIAGTGLNLLYFHRWFSVMAIGFALFVLDINPATAVRQTIPPQPVAGGNARRK